MANFIEGMVEKFIEKETGQGHSQGQGYGQGQSAPQQYGAPYSYNNGPPQVPYPWIAEWDGPANRWIFINRENGYRTFDHPQTPRGYGAGPVEQVYEERVGYGQPPQRAYYEQPAAHKDHSTRNTALGVAAGLAGGALLMHEGEKVEERWKQAEYGAEEDVAYADNYVDRKFDNAVDDVADFPQDAAQWTGRRVEEVEEFPGEVVERVEDVPGDVAGWAGRGVGDVERYGDDLREDYDEGRYDQERFDDRVEDAYEEGRMEQRYDDDY